MPATRKSMKSKRKFTKNVVPARRAIRSFGVRSERLPGDGTTFTLETAVPRSRFSPEARTFSCVQTFTLQSWFSTVVGANAFTTITVALNQVDQFATFQALFDQYQIDQVEAWIVPQTSADIVSSSSQLSSVIDLDDNVALTTIGQALDYASCVTSPGHTGHFRRWKPHINTVVQGASALTSLSNASAPYIDAAYPSVPHFGLKIASTGSIVSVINYDLQIKMHLNFRSVR